MPLPAELQPDHSTVANFIKRAMLEYLEVEKIDSYIADTGFRARDPRFKDHKAP